MNVVNRCGGQVITVVWKPRREQVGKSGCRMVKVAGRSGERVKATEGNVVAARTIPV